MADEGATGPVLAKRFLEEHGLTQREMAQAIGVSGPTIHDWLTEAKRPRDHHRKSIAVWTKGEVPEDSWLFARERAAIAGVTPFEPAESGEDVTEDTNTGTHG